MVVLNDYGFPPSILPGLGAYENYGKQPLFCKVSGGEFCSPGGARRVGDVDQPIGKSKVPSCGAAYNSTIPTDGSIYDAQIFWDQGANGKIEDCFFALQNFQGEDGDAPANFNKFDYSTYTKWTKDTAQFTLQSMESAISQGYYPYYPMRSRRSSFFDYRWLSWDPQDSDVVGLGKDVENEVFFNYQPLFAWGITSDTTGDDLKATGRAKSAFGGQTVKLSTSSNLSASGADFTLSDSKEYTTAVLGTAQGTACDGEQCLLDHRAGFTQATGTVAQRVNVMSRMMQKEALHFAQGAFFVTIVIVQWADLLICKTRWLSIKDQGMSNHTMNFGLVFETILAAWLCYVSGINKALGTRNLRLLHWFTGLPFSLFIFLYDETRKYIMRSTSKTFLDKDTGRLHRQPGWLERNTYY
jgi:sodium/potassium-transporting ATPase subunit alpha